MSSILAPLALVALLPGPGDSDGEQIKALFERTDTLLLGEIHGSAQIPLFALRAATAAQADGRATTLGLEIWSSEQAAIDRYVTSKGDASARAALLGSPFWSRVLDGRASSAMFEVVEGARDLVAKGRPLRVLCFDARNGSANGNGDASMAAFLIADRSEHPQDRYVLLTGNAHARTLDGTRWDPNFVPMGRLLLDADPRLLSLNARHSGGGFWASSDSGVGPQDFGGHGSPAARGIELFAARDERGHHGAFDVGPSTASPPASAKAVNAVCPRSGKAVEPDSLAIYRGLVVGFCNTHCRDDFAANVVDRPEDTGFFDERIAEMGEAGK